MRLAKRTAIITGGSRGIGRKIAEAFLSEGANIIIVSRQASSCKQAAKELEAKYGQGKVDYVCADVSDPAQVEDAFSVIEKADILVNSAGVLGPVGKFVDNDLSVWKKTVEVNLLGTAYCCRYALPILKKSGFRPKIINIGGGGAAYARPMHSSYAASKAAVVRLSENIAAEEEWLDVNALAPGAHKTDLWKEETHDSEPDEWADDERFTETMVFMGSEKSDGISGRFFHIYNKWEEFSPAMTKTDNYTLRHKKE